MSLLDRFGGIPVGIFFLDGSQSKYAYATYKGVVKDIYEIHSWVPAGTQEYFTRTLDEKRLATNRWEFVGRKAPEELCELYIGKIIEKKRSFGSSFIRVGCES